MYFHQHRFAEGCRDYCGWAAFVVVLTHFNRNTIDENETMNVHISNILKVISKISLKPNLSRTIVINQKSVKGNVAVVDRMGKEPSGTVGLLIYYFQLGSQTIVLRREELITEHSYGMSGASLNINLPFFVVF